MNKEQTIPHDSAHTHVAGRSTYIDDILEPEGTLHMALGLSPVASGKIRKLDLAKVLSSPGVVWAFTHDDIEGETDISAIHAGDEPILAKGEVLYHAQPIFAVIAKSRNEARRAARMAEIEIDETTPIVEIADALKGAREVIKGGHLKRGDVEAGLKSSTHQIKGTARVGGQEHFYLEGQVALAIPGENKEMMIYSSTQNPTEVQHLIAHLLDANAADITVEARRLGGGFGGKETQPVIFAGLAALAARKLSAPVKICLDRDDDFAITGKRHDFEMDYHVGYDDEGIIKSFDATLAARCGYSADLSGPVTDRALFHADNCYFYENVKLKAKALFTNTASNTAFRGFGGPQGIFLAEEVMDNIAAELGLDPLELRLRNLYGEKGDITPYHQQVTHDISRKVLEELARDCDYHARREAINQFNKKNRFQKKGIAITPVKFGISFTATFFNQAGAQVSVYKDGTVQVNHGGIEMGQGLNVKMKDVVAKEFGITHDMILATPTNTSKVPNTSATAASSGSDLNGKAVEDATRKVKASIAAHFAKEWKVREIDVQFADGQIYAGNHHSITWKEAINACYFARVSLFSSGFYKTPEIHWDAVNKTGQPFYYFAYGAACSEVLVDRFTGDYEITRIDILHDVGKSLNEAIDIGQVEGGFVQGIGWMTREELVWDQKGVLRTHAPSTYKIPLASDIPQEFHTKLIDWSENPKPTIRRSKAVGEPPFCLAISAYLALKMAVRAVGDNPRVHLDAPATPERVLMAMDARDGGL